MKKLFILILVVVSLPSMAKDMNSKMATEAKTTVCVKGVVVDEITGEALIGASIEVAGEKVFTDFDGAFEMNLTPTNNLVLQAQLVSYQKQSTELKLDENTERITIKLASVE